MIEAIEFMLEKYNPKSTEDYTNALKEILQEIILLGLDRSGFFEHAAFYGGTALRILYNLDRYSEDLDFTLLEPNMKFNFTKYFKSLERELSAFGFEFNLQRLNKEESRNIESAFLKTNTQILFLKIKSTKEIATKLHKEQVIKIKFEVDVNPSVSFKTEIKTLMLPTPFTVNTLTLPSLFAGKMHAVLMRKWKTRIKGRDFYDLQWYLSRNVSIDKKYLSEKLMASGAIKEMLTKQKLNELFEERIETINWEQAKLDVLPFLRDKKQVQLWSSSFFKEIFKSVNLD